MRALLVAMMLLACPLVAAAQTAPTPPAPVTAPATVEAVRGASEATSSAATATQKDKAPTPAAATEKKRGGDKE